MKLSEFDIGNFKKPPHVSPRKPQGGGPEEYELWIGDPYKNIKYKKVDTGYNKEYLIKDAARRARMLSTEGVVRVIAKSSASPEGEVIFQAAGQNVPDESMQDAMLRAKKMLGK